jgi:hypothetical protein
MIRKLKYVGICGGSEFKYDNLIHCKNFVNATMYSTQCNSKQKISLHWKKVCSQFNKIFKKTDEKAKTCK